MLHVHACSYYIGKMTSFLQSIVAEWTTIIQARTQTSSWGGGGGWGAHCPQALSVLHAW